MSAVAQAPFVIDVDRPIKVGVALVVVGFLGFLLWATFAPLTSAAVAPGTVVADSRNKTIAHLEGGILREVLVREGARVNAGDVLARIDSAATESSLGRLSNTRSAMLAQEARLVAERDGLDSIPFPKELTNSNAPASQEAVRGQEKLFATRRDAQTSERAILDQRIAQYDQEIVGLEAQITAEDRQLALIEDELEDVRHLVNKGLERKPRLLALERNAAELGGRRGEHVAMIARARQSIAEMQQRLVNLKAQNLDDAVSELREVQTKLADLNGQIYAAADSSRRLEVLAPVSGRVVSVFHETPGGVVKSGETILELLPDQDQLMIEAHVRPEDIDTVSVDHPARVRLTAYSQRRSTSLHGRVQTVSADRVVDPKGEKAYYLARVVVDMDAQAKKEGLKLHPGMPAQVFIETGRQSVLDYLLRPLFDGIERGFREE